MSCFEELDLQDFGNRLPQLTFEVFRPLPDADVAEGLVPAVAIIPGSPGVKRPNCPWR